MCITRLDSSNNKDAAHPLAQIKLLKHPIINEGSVGLWRHCYTIKHVDHDNNILMSSDCGSTTDWTGLFSHPEDKKYFQMAQAFSYYPLFSYAWQCYPTHRKIRCLTVKW